MKTVKYVVGDVHGCLSQLTTMLKMIDDSKDTNANNQVIFLGDYIDRGPNIPGTIDKLMEYQAQNPNTIFLMGNHDLELTLGHNYLASEGTMSQYGGVIPDNHMEWLKALKPYYEDEKNYYIHGGLPFKEAIPKLTHIDQLVWIRESERMKHNKVLIVGHTPHSSSVPVVYKLDGEITGINLDGGCCFGGFLLCAIMEDGEYNGRFMSISNSNKGS